MAPFEQALALSPGATYMSALIRSGLADALQNLGRLDETVQMRKQALDGFRVLLAKTPGAANVLQSIVREQRVLGDSLMQFARRAPTAPLRAARTRDACAAYDEGLAGQRRSRRERNPRLGRPVRGRRTPRRPGSLPALTRRGNAERHLARPCSGQLVLPAVDHLRDQQREPRAGHSLDHAALDHQEALNRYWAP